MNTACGAKTFMVTPAELKELVPQVDLTGGGRYPVLGALAPRRGRDRPARSRRLGVRRRSRRSAASTSSSTRR